MKDVRRIFNARRGERRMSEGRKSVRGRSFNIVTVTVSFVVYVSVTIITIVTVNNYAEKKTAHHVCTHITFKLIELEGPVWSGFVTNSKPDQT